MKSWLLFLPIVAALSAFTLKPPALGVRQSVQTLFVPVSYPSRLIGIGISNALSPPQPVDMLAADVPRTPEQLRAQNAELITQLVNLRAILSDMEQLSQQYRELGTDIRKLVEPATIISASESQRQTLSIATTGMSKVRPGMAVIYGTDFIGTIHAVGLAGESARVLLATDPASKIEAAFARVQVNSAGRTEIVWLDLPPPLVEGTTRGMIARLLPPREIRDKLKTGDIVVLGKDSIKDPKRPQLAGLMIGRVARIDASDVRHAEVVIEPRVDYASINNEVLVVTK